MKKLLIIISLLAIAILLVGCAQPAKQPPAQQGDDTANDGETPENGDSPQDAGTPPPKPSFDFGQNQKDDLGSLGQ